MGLCLIFTYARSAWLGIAGAVIALAFIKKRKAPVIILILILVIITLSLLSPSFVQRLISITDIEEETITDRFDAWQGSLAIIREHPLTGIGLNSFPYVYPRYMPFTGRRNLVHAHNIFFQLGVEMGLLSVLSFIWLLVVIFREGISALRNISAREIFAGNKTQGSKVSFPYLEGLIGGILAGLVGFMIQEQFNFSLVLNDIVIFFWINIALLMAACRLTKAEF